MKLPKTHYFYGKPIERIANMFLIWANKKGYQITYYGYMKKPYTFWKRLLSFKWVPYFKTYFPINIRKYNRNDL